MEISKTEVIRFVNKELGEMSDMELMELMEMRVRYLDEVELLVAINKPRDNTLEKLENISYRGLSFDIFLIKKEIGI